MLLKNKLKSHNKYGGFGFERKNEIEFSLYLWITYFLKETHSGSQLSSSGFVNKNQGFQEEKQGATGEIWGPNIGLNSVTWIKLYPLFSCCLLSTLRLWARFWLPEQQHFPCSKPAESGQNIPCIQHHKSQRAVPRALPQFSCRVLQDSPNFLSSKSHSFRFSLYSSLRCFNFLQFSHTTGKAVAYKSIWSFFPLPRDFKASRSVVVSYLIFIH